jgi:hypothetical protein
MQRGGIVDAVAHKTDDIAGLAQGQNDVFFLIRLHLGKIWVPDPAEQGFR